MTKPFALGELLARIQEIVSAPSPKTGDTLAPMAREDRGKRERRQVPPRVQAPKQRRKRSVQAPRRREPTTVGWSRRNQLAVGGGAAFVAGAVVLAVVLARGGGGADAQEALAAAGCTFKTYPSEGQAHVSSLQAKVRYKSFPPTSGRHYYQPAIWGSYPTALSLVQEVHNLEHGGVVVQYGNRVEPATIDQLNSFYSESPNGVLMAPLPKLGNKVALTAWTHLATCTSYNEKAFDAFRGAYRGKGPERFPISSLTPGS